MCYICRIQQTQPLDALPLCTTKVHTRLKLQNNMMENVKKRAPRRTPKAAAFHAQVAEIKHLLPRQYSEFALQIFSDLDAEKLRYAVAGRAEYWEGLPALRILAGIDPLPKGITLRPIGRALKQTVTQSLVA